MNNKLPIKLVIFGGYNSGKTEFIQYLMFQNIDINSYISSIPAQFFSKIIIFHEQKLRLDIWDTGQERFEALIKIFMKNACIIFLFYDSYDKSSFERAKNIYNSVKDFCDIKEAVYDLVSSRYDIHKNSKEKVSEEEALEFASNNNMPFAHISIVENFWKWN